MEMLLIIAAFSVSGLVLFVTLSILYVIIHNKMIVRKANKFGTPDLCCCGSTLEQHGWGDNHPFVSEMDYFIESNTKQFK